MKHRFLRYSIVIILILFSTLSAVFSIACQSELPKGRVVETRAWEFPSRGLNTVEIEALVENVGGSGYFHVLAELTPKGYGTNTKYTPINLKRNEQRYVRFEFICGKAGFNYTYKVWCEEVKARPDVRSQ